MPADAAEMITIEETSSSTSSSSLSSSPRSAVALLAAGCYELDESAAVRRGAVRLYSVRPGADGEGGRVQLESSLPSSSSPSPSDIVDSCGHFVSGVFDLKWKMRGRGLLPLLAHAAADGSASVYEAARDNAGAFVLQRVARAECTLVDDRGTAAPEASYACLCIDWMGEGDECGGPPTKNNESGDGCPASETLGVSKAEYVNFLLPRAQSRSPRAIRDAIGVELQNEAQCRPRAQTRGARDTRAPGATG